MIGKIISECCTDTVKDFRRKTHTEITTFYCTLYLTHRNHNLKLLLQYYLFAYEYHNIKSIKSSLIDRKKNITYLEQGETLIFHLQNDLNSCKAYMNIKSAKPMRKTKYHENNNSFDV